jgi:hypothetical protein
MFFTRRIVLKLLLVSSALTAIFLFLRKKIGGSDLNAAIPKATSTTERLPLGVDEEGIAHVFMTRNGTPAENMKKTIEMMGGIEKFIEPTDVVVLKPNAQWWNQGTTNTDAMQAFIDMVLAIPGFSGEVIVAENHQYDGDNSRGWNTEKRNGRFNLNELVEYYQGLGFANVTKYHWQVAGTTAHPLEGDAQGDGRVNGPQDGDGYVWLEDCYYLSPKGRKCIMTYPVFTSSYSGITLDLKYGAWKDGRFRDDTHMKFINFSSLNHHGSYCGVTASIKNLMGVVDMSCGFPGDRPEGTYNTHHIGVSELKELRTKRFVWRIARLDSFKRYINRDFHHTAGALGYFMKNIRLPDLNIVTAEWVGWGSRTAKEKSFRPQAILAGRDPVALDYIAAKEILLPGTPWEEVNDSGDNYRELNNPDIRGGSFRKFLQETQKQGIGVLDAEKIRVVTYEYS